ncbi:MAG: hydrogenase expression/formation protein HypE [Candidatus Aceula meridiana]|nr:hydrogenase expression/formation protein HypE [Candidatus Aceula meridiana]
MKKDKDFQLSCPIPIKDYPQVLLAHGSGGVLMHQLIEKIFHAVFKNPILDQAHDGAVLDISGGKIATTTDSFVVYPLFFPGGDIGSLAVHGTVNDLAMCGARPKYLTAGFILEEGLPMETLWRVVNSMQQAAQDAGVQIVAGDTKVVDKGKADGIFINTTGIGIIEHDREILPQSIEEGDVIVLSGDIGRHGIAIMAVREGLSFESEIKSDAASLSDLVMKIFDTKASIKCLRDLTRGGLATSLVEIAKTSGLSIEIEEKKISVREDVNAACEILGLDPLYVANEGRFICFVPPQDADKVLKVMMSHPQGKGAGIIGYVKKDKNADVIMQNQIGTLRIIDMLSGGQLPRIC